MKYVALFTLISGAVSAWITDLRTGRSTQIEQAINARRDADRRAMFDAGVNLWR